MNIAVTVVLGALLVAPVIAQDQGSFPIEEATIASLQEAMESGRLTSEELVKIYLVRIESIDGPGNPSFREQLARRGPSLNSIIELNPDALKIARERDAERKAGRVRGPLHGIPIVIKDNIDTADRMMTTAGSLALEGNYAKQDAFIVGKLREAGAVLLGKANLSEWANFRSTRSTSGWSSRGGQTRNPYVLSRNPCGSSSGSAAAVSANLVTIAIGTETDGSVVCPSSANGIVGVKPTLGLWSRSGIIPIAHSQDTAGPMARTVEDAAILLGALTGRDARDEETTEGAGHSKSDYTSFLDPDSMKGKRIGVVREEFGFDPDVDALMDEAIEVMKKLGAEIVDPVELDTSGEYGESEYTVLLYEFKAGLETYLAEMPERVKSRTLADLIEFNEANEDRMMPYFGQEIFELANAKGPLTDAAYTSALKKNHDLSRREGIDETIATDNLDAIIAPTLAPAWPTDLVNGDHYIGGYSQPSAVSGYPHITVPLGFVHGLPVGVSFFGEAWSEPKLLGIAYAFEQATRARQAPKFLTEVEM
ncbi:MAG: amidase [Acidobacteria bacterium]|nr:amidase [Acidobacteriota bacterium]